MSVSADTANLPKAVLYTFPTSVWSTVPLICLWEKGYSPDEYDTKQVDLTKGENLSPGYLRINHHGSIPTLVVPMLETTGPETETRFRSLKDTISICEFLDKARTPSSPTVLQGRPAPILAPATIEGKIKSDQLIELVHIPAIDPNFLALTARDEDELKRKAAANQDQFLSTRREAIERYLAEARSATKSDGAAVAGSWETSVVAFLESKQNDTNDMWEIYHGSAGQERKKQFFEASKRSWEEQLPHVFARIEEEFEGPFLLGDQLCLADLHLIALLTRIVTIAGGQGDAQGINTIEPHLGGAQIGAKLRAFWEAWIERNSFKKVYPTILIPAVRATNEATA
ncbi:hypothetical protein Q5752_000800 [Cryptotrichosporon argae]